MSDLTDYLSTTTYLPPIEEVGQRALGQPARKIHSRDSPIHTLNDDVLLNIFYLYRLDVPDEYDENGRPNFDWDDSDQRWWYKLVQVCRRWRYLILASPSRLDLHLLCTNGVPIADMLAHSPPLPLSIYYSDLYPVTLEDKEGILLALRHSDRVHYITLDLLSPKLRKIMTTMDNHFPILERLYIQSLQFGDNTSLVLPRTFQAPHLRHLSLSHAALPIGSPLLTTTLGLVTLELGDIPPSAYFPPSYLLTRLSLMPQLEILVIEFHSPLPNRDFERQLLHTPTMTHIMLPNLRELSFKGVSAYLEDLLPRISTPVLGMLYIELFHQLTFTVSHLVQFMDTPGILRFSTVLLAFDYDHARLRFFQPGKADYPPFRMQVNCRHLDQQVAFAVQILTALQPVLLVVEKLKLRHEEHIQSLEWHNRVDRTLWRQLLRSFNNLETLHVQGELVGKLAHSLQSDDGEPPLELLPSLKELGYSGGGNAWDAFTPFIDERQVAGHPVNLTRVDDSAFRWL
ncbi:hypothetical protein BJV78DRAFT_909302 [Lactifluus subvellereus]|nr:hypothetical protein BJV78DRAFT_909302 [Lactifluus subvellereus]